MKDLREATEAELRAELERRAAPKLAAPSKLPVIDWAPLEIMLDEYVAWIASDGYHDDEDGDWRVYIHEKAVTTVFGGTFWAWKAQLRP